MEGIQILKYCPWISKKINLKEYFQDYKEVLRNAGGGREHYEKVDQNVAINDFFEISEEGYPLSIPKCNSSNSSSIKATGPKTNGNFSSEAHASKLDSDNINFVEVKDIKTDIVNSLENNISPELLTVKGELPQRDSCKAAALGRTGRYRNWFAGSFMDGIIPEEAPDHLQTLVAQTKELYKRETKKDYIRHRHRQLKYSSTVRMVRMDGDAQDYPPPPMSDKCLDDIVCNVRIQRPYHKKTSQRKGINDYPKYSEEFLVLGSQCLTELKDSIMCVNEHYCHQEMSENPNLEVIKYCASIEDNFPSAFFYINGVFYIDKRNPAAIDISERVREWAKSVETYEPLTVQDMSLCKFSDLNIHLGYPYLYQHLGNCEHLITFTDVRLHHRRDVADPTKYPILRGNPVKLSYKCLACNLYLASWVVKESPILPTPVAHFCHSCLKMMFYNGEKKIGHFKLYPFMDEFAAKKRKMAHIKKSREKSFNHIVIDGWNIDGSSEFTFIK